MSHGIDLPGQETASGRMFDHGFLSVVERLLERINHTVLIFSQLALLAASLILTSSVVLRYYLKIATDWQDEAAVFLLVGMTFLSAASVQSQRGHIGIEAIASLLPPAINTVRKLLCDVVSLAFCTFFTWKSWALLHEAIVDGSTTSSTWAPPLWIPYGLMTAGMGLLVLQFVLQVLAGLFAGLHAPGKRVTS